MGKTPSHTPKLTKKFYPFVSVCTPTFNRRPFIPIMFECFRNQTYPKERIEWIIVDDGTDKIRDLVDSANIPQIRYFSVDQKMTLGAKRNYMHEKTKGTIIVYMDDDDYYPPERVSHAVDTLTANKQALCAGSSEIYIYFKHIQQMYQCGPYGPNHATAGTFAFKSELLKQTKYEETASLAEEKAFLKNYTIPFVQLDPMKTILVFSHEHNTFDKRKLLANKHPDFFKESPKTVDMFIRETFESAIKQFFMNDIDQLLRKYEPGEPKMKPDVLKQIKEIDEERAKMAASQPGNGQIMVNKPGEPPRALTNEEVVKIISSQQEQLNQLIARNKELEFLVKKLQEEHKQLNNKIENTNTFFKTAPSSDSEHSSVPEIPIEITNKSSVPDNKPKSEPETPIENLNKSSLYNIPSLSAKKLKSLPEVKIDL
jgi:glycosyltransferase involved in cell wall biosynthesis